MAKVSCVRSVYRYMVIIKDGESSLHAHEHLRSQSESEAKGRREEDPSVDKVLGVHHGIIPGASIGNVGIEEAGDNSNSR